MRSLAGFLIFFHLILGMHGPPFRVCASERNALIARVGVALPLYRPVGEFVAKNRRGEESLQVDKQLFSRQLVLNPIKKYPMSFVDTKSIAAFATLLLLGCSVPVSQAVPQAVPQTPSNVDSRSNDDWGFTPLMEAAKAGNVPEIKRLLAAGAQIDLEDNYGDTPLMLAAWQCHTSAVLVLLEANPSVNKQNQGFGSSALMLATDCSDIDSVKAILSKGADTRLTNKHGFTALMSAVLKNEAAIAKALLDAGAPWTDKGPEGQSLLYVAAERGYTDIVVALIEAGESVDVTMGDSDCCPEWIPLMIAVAENHPDTVSAILQFKPLVNAGNVQGRTALMFAANYGFTGIAEALLNSGADPNIIPNDEERVPALVIAAAKGHLYIVRLLLDKGANPNITDGQGKTALQRAKQNGNQEIVALLQSFLGQIRK